MKLERKTRVPGSLMVLAAALASACVNHVDVGAKSCPCASGYVCCESGVCAADSAACGAATSSLSESAAGTWSGHIETLSLPQNVPDSLRLILSVAADGTFSGQVTFAGSAPPPPTDPERSWPPNYDITMYDPSFLPGTSYAVHDLRWQSRRLRFSLDLYEAWQPFCALQQPFPLPDLSGGVPAGVTPGDTYWCNAGMIYDEDPAGTGTCTISLSTGVKEPVSCQKYWMCSLMCQCDAGGCHAKPELTNMVDIAFDGASASGSISLGLNYNLRLMRDPS